MNIECIYNKNQETKVEKMSCDNKRTDFELR